jgi:AAA15 family ATPase/GTPase
MILQFSIKNYRTFKESAVLSFIASNYDKDTRENENIHYNEKFGLRLLKSAVIYGANASGKSKLLDAFAFMRHYVINSSKEGQKGDEIDVHPFRLNSATENEPSEFEIIFILVNAKHCNGWSFYSRYILIYWHSSKYPFLCV